MVKGHSSKWYKYIKWLLFFVGEYSLKKLTNHVLPSNDAVD